MKVLIGPRVAGNSMYFVHKITALGSHDFEDDMNKVVHATKFPIKGATVVFLDAQPHLSQTVLQPKSQLLFRFFPTTLIKFCKELSLRIVFCSL